MPSTRRIAPVAADLVGELGHCSLFLDVDGTLLDIAETPQAVRVGAGVMDLLPRLSEGLEGALALVTGRRIGELDRLISPHRLPIAGVHGLERRDATGRLHEVSGVELGEFRRALDELIGAWPTAEIEDKGATIAFHFRRAPGAGNEARARLKRLAEARPEIEFLEAKMALEIKPRGHDKGTAISAFAVEPPFAGRRPIFLGDDIGDEPGFVAVNRLGGVSIRVGGDHPTAASYRLPDVAAAVDWLGELVAALGSKPRHAP